MPVLWVKWNALERKLVKVESSRHCQYLTTTFKMLTACYMTALRNPQLASAFEDRIAVRRSWDAVWINVRNCSLAYCTAENDVERIHDFIHIQTSTHVEIAIGGA
jgi:hypothetical protein